MKLRTACTRDCPDACSLLVTVEDGRAVKLQGDPDHPVTKGFLCYRTSRFLQHQYDDSRLTKPMLRGRHGFKPVGWDAALDLIAEKMLRIKREHGGGAILFYRSGGSLGLMKHVTEYFFEKFGPVTLKIGDICNGAGEAAQELDFGISESHDLEDIEHARTIVLWGKNCHVSSVHLIPRLKAAKKRGVRIVQIDPIRHRGADLANLFLQPRQGGDIALALGAARVLYDRDRTDPELGVYCNGSEQFHDLVHSHDASGWAKHAGVPREQLEALAEAYADGPTATLVGWGMQRRRHGAASIRTIDALGAVSGNLGIPGGGVSFYFQRRGAFDLSFAGGLATAPRSIPEPQLGQGILDAKDPPVRMVWVTAGNPVAMLPDSLTVARALRSRELTVVADSFLTDTAREAHLVLPVTTMLEDDDLVGSYGHHYLAEVRPLLTPPGAVRTDYAIVQGLAKRLGISAPFDRTNEEWKQALLRRVLKAGVTRDAFDAPAVRNPMASTVLFSGRVFPTEDGRANLITEVILNPAVPTAERPLLLMAVSHEKAQASQALPGHQDGPARAIVHPDGAAGFQPGDRVIVESEIGSMEVVLAFDDRQRTDVLILPKGGWLSAGRCANVLVPAEMTDLGGGACYYDTPVCLKSLETQADEQAHEEIVADALA